MSLRLAKTKPATFKRRQTRKRKGELIAPVCADNCQVAHTIEQTAALLCCSVDTIRNMITAGLLPSIPCGIGLRKQSRRVPHSAIRALLGA